MALEKVRALKQEWATLGGDAADQHEYPEPLNPQEDALEAAGYYIQPLGSAPDDKVLLDRSGDHLQIKDGLVPLTRRFVDWLIEALAIDTVGTTDTYTYSGNNLTQELLTITSSGLSLRSIDYTYSGGQVSTEVIKVYAANGSTVIGQVTRTYTYSGNRVTSVATVRNV